jgi:uncharacterized protein with von Willebrand factor type A (vWA) domain
MFSSLPQYLREQKLLGDVRTLLLLKKSMERGLINTLGDLYLVLKGLVTTAPKEIGPFTVAFYQYFLDIHIQPGESLDMAVSRSEAFQKWKNKLELGEEVEEETDVKALVEQFLNEVHLTTYDIRKILSGSDILQNDDPNRPDTEGPDDEPAERLDRMADYSNLSLEELLERMRKVMEQQRRKHSGGDHWVGTGGISPYGHSGAAQGGIRVGGQGGGKMARKVMADPHFFPVDTKVTLSDNNIDVALSYLKGIEEESVEQYLDVPETISEGVKEGGLFLPQIREKVDQKVQVLLLIDNGGWSMSPYIASVTKLFSKMKRRFAHDLKTYYYHNTLYGGAYSNPARIYTSFESMDKICSLNNNYAVFIIGDADMAPYELTPESLANWQQLVERFPRVVWLNPMSLRYWAGSYTVNILRQVFEMYPLSPWGIEKGVGFMNKKKKFSKE